MAITYFKLSCLNFGIPSWIDHPSFWMVVLISCHWTIQWLGSTLSKKSPSSWFKFLKWIFTLGLSNPLTLFAEKNSKTILNLDGVNIALEKDIHTQPIFLNFSLSLGLSFNLLRSYLQFSVWYLTPDFRVFPTINTQ